MALALGVGIGVPFGGLVVSNAVLLLSTAGPYGAVMDYTDASISIADSTGALNYQSKGDVSGGALIGPAAKLTYAAPSPKLLEQSDGVYRYQAHNLNPYSENDPGWAGGGTTPPAVNGNTVVDGRVCCSVTFTAASSTGYAGSRATGSQTASLPTYPVALSYEVKFSRPLIGAEQIVIYSTGSYAIGTKFFNASICPTQFTAYELTGTQSVAGNVYFTVYADVALASDVTVYVTKRQYRATPSASDYIKTNGTALYALPYRWSGGVRQGIEVEPQATNLALQSSAIDDATWTKVGATVSANSVSGISGALTGDKLIPDNAVSLGVGTSLIRQDFTKAASAVQYTLNVAGNAQGFDSIIVRCQDSGGAVNRADVAVNLTNGTITSAAAVAGTFTGASAVVTALPSGAYRLSLTFTTGADTFLRVIVAPSDSVATTGNGTSGIGISHIQLETGSVATSPIITYGAAVVRANDQPSLLNALFPYNGNTEGTYFAEFTLRSISGTQNIIAADLNGRGVFSNGTLLAAFDGTSSVTTGAPVAGVKARVSSSYGPGGLLVCKDGGAITTGAYDGTWGGSQNNMQIGWASGSFIGLMTLHRAGYFPVQKTGATLQAIGA